MGRPYTGDKEFGSGNVNVQDYAVNIIRAWGDIFCGFGAYSVQEVFFCAGESCWSQYGVFQPAQMHT